MSLLLGIAASAALLSAPEPAAAQAPVPLAELHSVLSHTDYPDDAIRKGEQGTVEFRLNVGVDGRVTGCTVVNSSGSAILDETTCRIMRERPTFRPAIGAGGKPVPGSLESRVSWRLPEDSGETIMLPPVVGAALSAWLDCSEDEAARLKAAGLSPEAIADQALARCTERQADARAKTAEAQLEDVDPDRGIAAIRTHFREQLLSSASARDAGQKASQRD